MKNKSSRKNRRGGGGKQNQKRNSAPPPLSFVSLLLRQVLLPSAALFCACVLPLLRDRGATMVRPHTATSAAHRNDFSSTSDSSLYHESSRSCGLWLATSSLPGDDAGLGLFAGRSYRDGETVGPPDVVVHLLLDVRDDIVHAPFRALLRSYAWDGVHVGGGQYEGRHVYAMLPGVGSSANGHSTRRNVYPTAKVRVRVDNAGVSRATSPGAGAFTRHHGSTFVVAKTSGGDGGGGLQAGDEILIDYGREWFEERNVSTDAEDKNPYFRSLSWLSEHGVCVDNLRPGRSKIPHAGRGAFATRFVPEGAVIASSPLLPIPRARVAATRTRRVRADPRDGTETVVDGEQLLVNYCFVAANDDDDDETTTLLWPYAPAVQLINHDGDDPVARVRRSERLGSNDVGAAAVIDYVATRDVWPGDEVTIDYGRAWAEAWDAHVRNWEPVPGAEDHVSAHALDERTVPMIRTEDEYEEEDGWPYPDNVFTSCHVDLRESDLLREDDDDDAVATVAWRRTTRVLLYESARPCRLVSRNDDANEYIVRVAVDVDVLPRQRGGRRRSSRRRIVLVTGVPRNAIRFEDKIYTTDQHLENAFRQPIGLPNDLTFRPKEL